MVGAFYRIEFKQGEDFQIDIDLRDPNGVINTDGWLGSSSMQTLDDATPKDSNGDAIAFTVTFPVTGTVRLALPASKTVQLPAKRYLYDVKLTDASNAVAYYLEGDVNVRRSYTP